MNNHHSDTLSKALKLFENHEYAYAQNLLDGLTHSHPQDGRIRHYQHVCRIKNAQLKKTSLIAYSLKHIFTFHLKTYGLFVFLIEDNRKSQSIYTHLIQHFPLQTGYYWQLIALLNRQNKPKEILTYLQEILLIDPVNIKALKQIGEIYIKQGQLQEAKTTLNKLKALAPQDADIQRAFKNLSALEALKQTPFISS